MKTLRIKATVAVNKRTDSDGTQTGETVSLMAVQSDDPKAENRAWAIGKPEMNLDATISNPDAFGLLDNVREVYVDITPVPAKVAKTAAPAKPAPKATPKPAAKPAKPAKSAKPPARKIAPKNSKPKSVKKGKRK